MKMAGNRKILECVIEQHENDSHVIRRIQVQTELQKVTQGIRGVLATGLVLMKEFPRSIPIIRPKRPPTFEVEEWHPKCHHKQRRGIAGQAFFRRS